MDCCLDLTTTTAQVSQGSEQKKLELIARYKEAHDP